MHEPESVALNALVSAVYASERYGEHHRVAQEAAEQAARLLARRTRDGTECIIVFAEDRILLGETVLNDPRAVTASIGAALRGHGFQTVCVRPGVGCEDVKAFARDVMKPPSSEQATRIGTVHLSAGVIAGTMRHASHQRSELVQLCGPVADLHTGIIRDSRIKSAELEGIAEAVLCSFTSQSAAVLKLVEIENHDQYTMAHSVNVSVLAGALARSIGINEAAVETAVISALLHDIGKKEIPSSILLKNGPLSDDERRVVLNHPAAGAKLLIERDDIPLLASVVAFEHHRRLDKRGYPEPASATTPGVVSQIVQIADIYDALRSNRPYRRGMTVNQVLEIMSNDAGRAYDQALFEIFVDRVLIRADHSRGGECLDAAA